MTVRLIQVGLGGWGGDWAKSVLPRVASVETVASVDADPAARERARKVLGLDPRTLFASLDDALAATASDAVLAVLPTASHAAVAEAALRAGKHVLVEKPFTATLAEAAGLVEQADRVERLLVVSQNYRYHAAVLAAGALVRSSTYGRVMAGTIEFRQDWKASGHRYHDIPGPLLLDMGIHHFDMLRMIFGEEVERVACHGWTTPYSPFAQNAAAHALLRLRGGATVSYAGSWLRRGVSTTWSGQWTVELEGGDLLFCTRPERPGVPPEAGKLFLRDLDGKVSELEIDPVPAEDRAGTLDGFARAILTGDAPPFLPTGRDNVNSLAVSFACMRSEAEGGRWLEVAEVMP